MKVEFKVTAQFGVLPSPLGEMVGSPPPLGRGWGWVVEGWGEALRVVVCGFFYWYKDTKLFLKLQKTGG